MGEASGKKRKRDGESSAKSKKKVTINAPAATATVSSILQPKSFPPIIATTAGIEMPKDLSFQSYSREDEPRAKIKAGRQTKQKELMLHSDQHQSLEYTAKEEQPSSGAPQLHHFFGLYDPKTGELEVVQAKKMIIRGSVRAKQASAESMGDASARQSMMERRTELGETFGTKKAKKAIHDRVINAISVQKKAGDNSPTTIDDAARVMLQSVGKIATNMSTRAELQAVVDGAKPVPQANPDAEDIQDVYEPEKLIGSDILNLVPIREWQEKVRHNEGIQVASRFVACRVNAIASNEDALTRLRVLRYFSFVLLFYLSTKPGRQKGTRSIPPKDKLRELLAPAPEAVIENIRRKFADGGEMRKFHIDLLMTHCCAFACIVDNFEVDTQNLRDDLRVDQKTINQYFHEIGGRVKPVSQAEGKATYVARLMLPLDFPKQRYIKARR